ncbi:MAG: dephospho-CoA kinase [Methylobacter tundripaludum]|uniref:Dephospho-CoA kinase n=1 Tax=Methylobacter tundripaludum TaxID=173365 RepID=A0A2S6H7S9_9GAMM|nr:dephospho-CoA kinase [Methylobacter tundripaludum]MCF7966783.1 dephospho-CoA kinase [Methylobacter tundripaludum]PPK73535.1 dephospho-CoA kinase [Methylobacter tundripaludum]
MLKVGLTGGIGCGKSTVAKIFADFNIPVLDADEIAHRLVEPGQPALVQIRQEFGADILNPDGSLNRKKLRERVFSDLGQKQKLESILHPLIFKTLQTELEQLTAPYCIVSIPLLFETGMAHLVDRILVIDCPVEMQIERVKTRDKIAVERIQSIIDSQVSRATRKAKADDLIDNSGADYRLAEQVKKLHNLYLSLRDFRD